MICRKIIHTLALQNLNPTPTIIELADQSTIRPLGKLDDRIISVYSWKYSVDLLVLHTQSHVSGHPWILGIPWLSTPNSYIRCEFGNMVISNGEVTKNLILYLLPNEVGQIN